MDMVDSETNEKQISMPVDFQGKGTASVMMLVDYEMKQMVYEAASGGTARTFEIWDVTNLVAIGCDIAIVDPTLLSEDEWTSLCEWYSSYVDVQFRLLLVKPCTYKVSMPKRNIINSPSVVTAEFLRDQIRRASRTPKSIDVWRKKERQIHRLMYMLHCLDTSTLRLRDVADHFEVSLRTVQRDLEVLLVADYIIEDGDEPGEYRFPKGYKSHHAYYG